METSLVSYQLYMTNLILDSMLYNYKGGLI